MLYTQDEVFRTTDNAVLPRNEKLRSRKRNIVFCAIALLVKITLVTSGNDGKTYANDNATSSYFVTTDPQPSILKPEACGSIRPNISVKPMPSTLHPESLEFEDPAAPKNGE